MATNNNGGYLKYAPYPGKDSGPTSCLFSLKFWLQNPKIHAYKMSGTDFFKRLSIFCTGLKNYAQKFYRKFDTCELCQQKLEKKLRNLLRSFCAINRAEHSVKISG